jgi:hypothetical protein
VYYRVTHGLETMRRMRLDEKYRKEVAKRIS